MQDPLREAFPPKAAKRLEFLEFPPTTPLALAICAIIQAVRCPSTHTAPMFAHKYKYYAYSFLYLGCGGGSLELGGGGGGILSDQQCR